MVGDWILFLGLALVAVGSALGLLLSKSAVYAALNLIINFVTVALFYIILGAPFIALTQIAVYAGAIMVLFLFVIMLLGAEQLGHRTSLPWQRPLAFVLGGLLVVEAVYAIITRSQSITPGGALPDNFGAPSAVGALLFNTYLLPFEVVSILLLAAMVGAIVLSMKHQPKR
ncbi:NADH-quinone oxidoreductase subunit J [bacterium]|nr:MAG: NADH-quinone oxidoreductase subunit J [bacterium]